MSNKPQSLYAGTLIDTLRAIARDHGYALGVHGSLRPQRDIDLIAVPWAKKVHSPRTLMYAINKLPYLYRVKEHDKDPPKPHGRLGFVWLISDEYRHGTCPVYVDLSVIPPK